MKRYLSILTMGIALVAVNASVAVPVEQALKFKTVIPPDPFVIKPSTQWPAATAVTTLAYNNATDTFTAYTNSIGITSATLNVTAKLEKAASLVSGANSIPIEVKLGGKALTVTAQQIHPKGAAEVAYPLNIVPTGKDHPAGTYTGDVTLVFDGT